MKTMLAAYRSAYCTPELLRLQEVPVPVPGPDALLIKIMATTINRTDCALLTGKPLIMRLFAGLFRPKLPITGTDLAGIVVATGTRVTDFSTGDRVFGFNDMGLQSHAQYAAVDLKNAIMHIPDGISFSDAAASLEGVHYAVNFLKKVKCIPGQSVLVNGASGAIGSALVQILKTKGLHVTTTCRNEHTARITSLGADRVIDYTAIDFTKEHNTYDYIFDAAGKSTFGACKNALKTNGVYISSEPGRWLQNIWYALFTPLLPGKKVIFPVPADIRGSMTFITKLLAAGTFRPLTDRIVLPEKISDAFAYAASGEKTGNIIITPHPEAG